MGQAIIIQQNHVIPLNDSIELNSRDPATKRVWILDFDSISRIAPPVVNLELAPEAWNTWIDAQAIAFQLEPKNVFDRRAIHPARRPCVPGPTAAARVRRHGINITDCDVRLDFVLVQTRAGRGVIDRIQQAEQLASAIAVAEHGKRN